MDQKIRTSSEECHLEHCWILIGDSEKKLWWGRRRNMTKGHPCSVDFDPNYVLTREETHGDVVGFWHTHPNFSATPSGRDYRTMGAWCNCFGKSLICVIQGIDGLRGYWFDDDESEPVECQVKRFGDLLVGTTEIWDEEDEVSTTTSDQFFTNPVDSTMIAEAKAMVDENEVETNEETHTN